MATKTIQIGDKQAVYRIEGTGPAVVLLHGFGEDHRIWESVLPAFTGCQVLLPDLPGTGGSALQDETSMESMAAWVRELLDQEEIQTCVLIGHSMGGYIALAFAEAYPDRLRGFGLFHSSAYADTEEKKQTRRKGIDFIRQHGAGAFLDTTTPNLFAPATRETRSDLVKNALATWRDQPADSLVAYYEAMMARPDRTSVLRHARVPVLWILGRHDGPVPIKDGLAQVPLAPVTALTILEESGHMGMLEETEKSAKALRDFLPLVAK